MPQAATRIKTSPGPGCGWGKSASSSCKYSLRRRDFIGAPCAVRSSTSSCARKRRFYNPGADGDAERVAPTLAAKNKDAAKVGHPITQLVGHPITELNGREGLLCAGR